MPRMKWSRWLLLALATVVLVLYIFNLFRIRQFNPSGVIGGIVIVVIIVGIVGLVNSSRYGALRRTYPDAFVANIAIYPQLHRQLAQAAAAFDSDITKVGSTRSASIVLDKKSLRLFAGSGAPREIFALPASAISEATVTKASQGGWTLDSLEFRLTGDTSNLLIDLCLMNSKFGFPHALSGADVATECAKAAQVLHDS